MNADGSLFPADPLMVTPGSGPRHLTFSPDGKLVYVVSELNVSTSVFARDARTGALRFLSSMPNIAPGWPKGTGSAEIAVDPSKKWLIVSTRLKDFLTVFRINSGFVWPPTKDLDEAALPPLYQRQVFPSPVKFPRSFAIDPTGHWIVVAGETDSRITVMRFDPANGQLSTTGQFARVDRPVCVLFAP
jgi:6-phosphogluconolactonase